MHRMAVEPRADWQRKVEALGLHFHTLGGEPYWDESACYTLSRFEVDSIERATYALWEMCLELVQHVIDNRMFGLFLIPPELLTAKIGPKPRPFALMVGFRALIFV